VAKKPLDPPDQRFEKRGKREKGEDDRKTENKKNLDPQKGKNASFDETECLHKLHISQVKPGSYQSNESSTADGICETTARQIK
jgi:hypothetical protein